MFGRNFVAYRIEWSTDKAKIFLNHFSEILKILDLHFDTSSPLGEFFLTVLSAISQLEINIIRERTAEGIAVAKAQGKFNGRKKAQSN